MLTNAAMLGGCTLVMLMSFQGVSSTSDICAQPKVIGRCRAAFPRFYYNPTAQACTSFTYGGCGGNENNFKTVGECQRACADVGSLLLESRPPGKLSVSPPRPCPKYACKCPFGSFMTTDSNGCEMCSCNKEPSCPPVCKNFCRYGRVMDDNNCPTCECKPRPRCPPLCRNYCPGGRVMDKNGCPTCTCKPRLPVCPVFRCALPCPQGFAKDNRGCQTCSCKPVLPECPLIKCANRCRSGYEKNSKGCQTCECKPAECPVLKCRACPNGYEKDSNGCDTCRCKSRACPSFHCNFYCSMPERFSARMRECSCDCSGKREQLAELAIQ